MIPVDLKRRAERAACDKGVSLGELVRQALERLLGERGSADSLVSDSRVFYGEAPADLAEKHDEHLYGE